MLKWKQLIGRPVATDPDKLPTAEYDKYVQTVAGLTQVRSQLSINFPSIPSVVSIHGLWC